MSDDNIIASSDDGNSNAKAARPKRKRAAVGEKLRGEDKVRPNPVKIQPTTELPRKPDWIRVKMPAGDEKFNQVKSTLRKHKLATVCEEASCPNIGECFSGGTATFMIMGEICTRRCPFCDVASGIPLPLSPDEPRELAEAVAAMQLNYVVITSVDRDDLKDGGAQHFVDCISEIERLSPDTRVEVLVPDFRGVMDIAVDILAQTPPDVFNHNMESVPSQYKRIRPGARYQGSLDLLKSYKARCPDVLTKSGLMLGLGETTQEVKDELLDMRAHDVDMLTLGQYLQPSRHHLPVERFVHPDEFAELAEFAESIGFVSVASGPMVRSSYHADEQVDLSLLKQKASRKS